MYCFTLVNVFIIVLIFRQCCLAQMTVDGDITTLYQVWRISKISNNAVTATTSTQRSLVSCIIYCENMEYNSFHYIEQNTSCICNLDGDGSINGNDIAETTIRYGIRQTRVNTSYIQDGGQTIKKVHKQPEPLDCLSLYNQNYSEDCIYVINPIGMTSTDVWCDMTNGGWTVIQRRQDGSEDFYRNWEEYKRGFGNKVGEYWLGLENIHYLTINSSSLHIYMETFGEVGVDPDSAFAEYSTFRINDETDKYRLTVDGFTGSCYDSLSHHNNCRFTTKDNDNDHHADNCAQTYNAAWWYNACHSSNLNGVYLDTGYGRGLNWKACWGFNYSLKKIIMKTKRNN